MSSRVAQGTSISIPLGNLARSVGIRTGVTGLAATTGINAELSAWTLAVVLHNLLAQQIGIQGMLVRQFVAFGATVIVTRPSRRRLITKAHDNPE
ncbi:hypothetical protein QN360_01035 [Glaciimonas sp. CA11.2]|uniref:hypothetical protein n=1 Tax=Glaciimonas sp. CA11.2 TaxID=3048601 RepID=UPI002AB5BFE8|nr:hypothetical protein [Glaciimonas sp. CA11.2]MDY7549172.1 hypothetical protein [Glaciimonas sp. CA11.2]MEB0161492.1 hypothetical protein [Glaciimonas sp. CA11.2]